MSTEEDCQGDQPKKRCAGLDAASCGATEGCQMAQGRRLDEAKQCQVPDAIAGCTSGDCGDDAIALAKDPSGASWVFPSACYPDAWTEIGTKDPPAGWDQWGQCEAPKKSCAGLDATSCAATEGCEMAQGQRLDESNQCQMPLAPAGCTSGDCGDEEVAHAKDLSGGIWRFSTYCFPDGWTELTSSSVPADSDKWGACGG